MPTDRIVLNYQRDGDILYVTFGQEGRKGMGFNLHSNILLRFDRHISSETFACEHVLSCSRTPPPSQPFLARG